MSETNTEPAPDEQISPLSDEAIGAVVALVRVLELYDPAVAHRAGLRALVADRLAWRLDSPIDRSIFIAACALGDIDLLVTRPVDPEEATDVTRAMLADTLLCRLPGLRDVAAAVGSQREWWNGNGFPKGIASDQLPLAARVLAAIDELVANPAPGFVSDWDRGRSRVDTATGTALDPTIAMLVTSLPLDDIEAPLIPSTTIAEILDSSRSSRSANPDRATTITTAVESAGDVEDLLTLYARTARESIDANEVLVVTCTDTTFSHTPIAHATRDDLRAPQRTADLDFTMQGELRAGMSISHASAGDQHIDTLAAPIIRGDSCFGAILAYRSPSESSFDTSDLSVLRHVASEAVTAIGQSQHWAEMERMALYDQLTGLANRHELYRVLDEVFQRPAVERLDTALIMCDVDGLKIINDTLGHQAGDRLLMDAAASLRGAVRDPERTTVCRIGGDEFCLVIDGGALLTAYDVSDAIERLFARSGGSGEARSISCGIAFATEEVTSRSALLRAADENQYETKRARKAARAASAEPVVPAATGGAVDRRAVRTKGEPDL